MIDHIVVDVEIQKTIEQCSQGWDSTDEMGVSCACVWEYRTQRMRIYGPDDTLALQRRLCEADRVSGFNIVNFDYAVIWGASRQEWITGRNFLQLRKSLLFKSNDILRRVWAEGLALDPDVFNPKTHGGWSLDAVSKATMNAPGKIGYGGDAPKWFQAGQWARVASYCADDVALTKDLTNFIDEFGYVVNPKTGQVLHLSKLK